MRKILLVLLLPLLHNTSAQAQPTWADDIACIVYSHCSSCHNDYGIAPFNLMNYSDAYANRYAMQAAITSGSMPPWPPDQDYAPMAHANVLSDEEIAVFQDWVNAGAPEGDPAATPAAPLIESEAIITDPDVVLTTGAYTVPDNDGDRYMCFVIPTDWAEDKFINAVEVYPSNRNIVHHVLIYKDSTGEPEAEDEAYDGPGYSCFGGVESETSQLVADWVPGSRPRFLPEGTGIRIPSGTSLVVQVHYPEGSMGETDETSIRIKFEEGENIRDVYQDQTLDHIDDMVGWPLFLLPYETKTFHQMFVLPETRTFIGTGPHAHLICTRMWSFAIKPDGDTINMVNIPNWDFSWQGMYQYPEPIVLPAGTELHGYARYENTAENPNQPSDPPTFVGLGESTTDEMMIFFYSYLFYEPGDETLPIDAGGEHFTHHENCESQAVGVDDLNSLPLAISPNPVRDGLFHLSVGQTGDYTLSVTDALGREVFRGDCDGDCDVSLPRHLDSGVYFARLSANDGKPIAIGKIVLSN